MRSSIFALLALSFLPASVAQSGILRVEPPEHGPAMVLVDGDTVGSIFGEKLTLDVSPGSHLVEVVREGFVPFREQIEVTADAVTVVWPRIVPSVVRLQQGLELLRQGDLAGAVELFRQGVEAGQDPDRVGQMLLAVAYGEGVADHRWEEAIEIFEAARQFDLPDSRATEIAFWHGWSLYKRAEAAQEPGTVESARTTLPWFRRARSLMEGSRPYTDEMGMIPLDRILEAVDDLIRVQEEILGGDPAGTARHDGA